MQGFDSAVINKIRNEFSWAEDEVYLDHAGAGLYSSQQIKLIGNDLCSRIYGNPHSLNDASRVCSEVIDQVRSRILQLFNTTSENYTVIFTCGATAAIKLLLESFQWWADEDEGSGSDGEEFYDSNAGVGSYVYTRTNHTSVVGGRVLALERGASVICLDDEDARLLLSDQATAEGTPMEIKKHSTNSLFAFPAQCNFSGKLFPLNWLKAVKNRRLESHRNILERNSNWYTLLDAATFCATNPLDLAVIEPDFVCLSFYKIFGYPSGLGALLVRNTSARCLRKRYFGGGTVDVAIPSTSYHKFRNCLHASFEDGTLPFLSIISLSHGFDTLARLGLTMTTISFHVHDLARQTMERIMALQHWTGEPVAEIYCDCKTAEHSTHGGIVAFNLKRANGSYIGFSEVLKVSSSCRILLRTGCFCNIGACQKYLKITDEHMIDYYQKGHVCGDEHDLIEGRPTGAVRVSFGYPSHPSAVDAFIDMIAQTFLETAPSSIDPLHMPQVGSVILKSIRLYPVKSCGAMEVAKWRVTNRGLLMDRTWMVVSARGVCLTQKDEPMLCRILPSIHLPTRTLQLTFDGDDAITIDYVDTGTKSMCHNRVCGDGVTGVDCGLTAGHWLDRHLNRTGLRLVQQLPTDRRQAKQLANGSLSLANQAQYLVINSASVDFLRHRMGNEDQAYAFLQDRFRANFILQGSSAFEENTWQRLSFPNAELKVEGHCTRCQMICIDQKTGEKNKRPLVELSKALEGKLRFGVYCSNNGSSESEVAVGDGITVH